MTEWRKSSRSGGVNDHACVELARFADHIGIRDSTDPDGPCLGFNSGDFGGFLARVRGGELELQQKGR